MLLKKGLKKLKKIENKVTKKIKLKKNPLNIIGETSSKLGNFYTNFKKEREKEKIKANKRKICKTVLFI